MTAIVTFIEARLAEDEHGATHSGQLPVPQSAYHQRTLREVAAKRAIVRRYEKAPIEDVTLLLDDVRDLASVYSDHTDYDPAWRPLGEPSNIDLRPGMDAAAVDGGFA